MSDLTASRVARLVARYPLARAATALGEVSYRSAGAGAALVLLHGIGSQSGSWAQQLAALADRHRVVAWDAPGYGESAPLAPAAPTAADYAARLGDFLDALGIARAVLVASSLGALMAGAFAARWPERVAGLVLLNPAGGYGLAEPAVREAKLAARLERLATLGPAGMARNLPAGMLAPKASDTARALAAWGQSSIQPHGYAQAARMLANGRLAEDAARYAGPVLVVAADADTITPLAECQRIARAFPRARFRMVEGAGHLSYLDSPEVVNDAVTEFAARCAEEARVSEPRYNVPGLERGLRVLQLFDRHRKVLGAAEMARALAIPRSTAFRLAQTLEHLGYLHREGDAYRVGPAVLRLGFEYLASLELTDLARPILERLRDESGCSAQLVIRDGRDVVVVLKAAAPSTFASNVNVGTRMPAHATILGRVLLCDADDRTLAALYPESALPQVSAKSPESVAELKRLLREDRARGYAVSESFFEQGISAVAAPVRNETGAIVAAISITVQRPTLEPADLRERLAQQVLRSAGELSHQLNYRPAAAA